MKTLEELSKERAAEFPNTGLRSNYAKRQYPLDLILWIREDLKAALAEPDVKNDLIKDALDRLGCLEESLK